MHMYICIYIYIYIRPRCLIHDKVTDAHRPPHAHGGRRDAHAVALEYQHARSIQATRVSAQHGRGYTCAHCDITMTRW